MKYQTERNLYLGQNFSRRLIQKNITPEEVVSIHKKALEEIYSGISEDTKNSLCFLTEFMIQYGLAHQNHKILLRKQEEMDHEIELAANIQETMLKTDIPEIRGLELGFISVPARKMNGDYVYFQKEVGGTIGIGVADVVGKGIPAALCMSMVKSGLDTLGEASISPAYALDVLNRIVEKSVDDSMFISMFFGSYDGGKSLFRYASAGHEPALYYIASEDCFTLLDAKGLLLGVLPNVHFEEKEVHLEPNDMIIIMTDGVTECRIDHQFIKRSAIIEMIRAVKDESPQKIAEAVYNELQKLLNFKLQDDLTLAILKKSVE